ncbi:MAG TPA: flagella basal body P-ring formation protein FlgA, partial [Polyangiales bacterium]|nr:flagella basal body P-ring formation protein FlgA [Polyangiales bacterium]
KEDLLDESMEALTAAAGACDLQTARISNDAKVIAGPRTIHAELPLRSVVSRATTLHVSGAIYVESGGQRVRVSVMASLACPAPDVSAGTQLTVFAKIGTVRASAPAEARQPGRIGEIIRVTNRATGASLRVKILSPQMAEVVP